MALSSSYRKVQYSTRTFLTMYLGSFSVGYAVSSQLLIKSHLINGGVTSGLIHRDRPTHDDAALMHSCGYDFLCRSEAKHTALTT
jgi:hypothetical protein